MKKKRQRKKGAYSELSKLDPTRDTRSPSSCGYLASNIVNDIRQKAKDRGKKWTLDPIETYYLIKGACTYCGHIPNWPEARVGIDRVDNQKGYEPGNCVSCCSTCNSAKGDKSLAEFKAWINQAYVHQNK